MTLVGSGVHHSMLTFIIKVPIGSHHSKPVFMDSLMGMCERVSDSRESAWLANSYELQIRITNVLFPHQVGSAYGRAIRTISNQGGL